MTTRCRLTFTEALTFLWVFLGAVVGLVASIAFALWLTQ